MVKERGGSICNQEGRNSQTGNAMYVCICTRDFSILFKLVVQELCVSCELESASRTTSTFSFLYSM